MTRQQIFWTIYVVIFVLPLVFYFVANGYWWLYDGNIPNAEKMGAALTFGLLTTIIALAWHDLGDVWK